jgi:hypothetical protein
MQIEDSVCSLCSVHKTKVLGFNMHVFTLSTPPLAGKYNHINLIYYRACSAVVIALRFGTQGPGFEPCLFHKAWYMPLHGC